MIHEIVDKLLMKCRSFDGLSFSCYGLLFSVCIYWKINPILLSFLLWGVCTCTCSFFAALCLLYCCFGLCPIQHVLYFHLKWWKCLFSWNLKRQYQSFLVKLVCCITVDPSMSPGNAPSSFYFRSRLLSKAMTSLSLLLIGNFAPFSSSFLTSNFSLKVTVTCYLNALAQMI